MGSKFSQALATCDSSSSWPPTARSYFRFYPRRYTTTCIAPYSQRLWYHSSEANIRLSRELAPCYSRCLFPHACTHCCVCRSPRFTPCLPSLALPRALSTFALTLNSRSAPPYPHRSLLMRSPSSQTCPSACTALRAHHLCRTHLRCSGPHLVVWSTTRSLGCLGCNAEAWSWR